jgi:hypothetical protein
MLPSQRLYVIELEEKIQLIENDIDKAVKECKNSERTPDVAFFENLLSMYKQQLSLIKTELSVVKEL